MSRRNSNYVHVTCELHLATDKAVKVAIAGTIHWLPFSQMAEGEEDKIVRLLKAAGQGEIVEDVTISITEWIADQKGIDGEDD
jgi:hypothetical protein